MNEPQPPQRYAATEESRRLLPPSALRTLGYCLTFLALAATAWVAWQVLFAAPLVFYSVAAALLLAALLAPLVGWLADRGVARWLGALLGVLLLVFVVVGTGALVVGRASAQVDDLRAALQKALAAAHDFLVGPPLSLPESRLGNLQQRLFDFIGQVLPSAGAGAALALQILSGIAIAVFVLFFLLKDGEQMWQWARRWTPPQRRALVDDLGARAWETLTGYALGMVVVALVDAVAIGIALVVLGVPLAISLTLLVFLGAFVPVLGATVSGAVAVAVTAATVGLWQAAVVLGVVLLVQQLEGNLVQPLVMGRAVKLHPVVIVLAVTAGAVLGGVGGAVIAVPVTAVGYRVLDRLIGPSAEGSPAGATRPDS